MLVEHNQLNLALGVVLLLILLLLTLLGSVLLALGSQGAAAGQALGGLLDAAQVVPDVLDPFSPQALLHLRLGPQPCALGAHLPLEVAQQAPSVRLVLTPSAPAEGRYTLVRQPCPRIFGVSRPLVRSHVSGPEQGRGAESCQAWCGGVSGAPGVEVAPGFLVWSCLWGSWCVADHGGSRCAGPCQSLFPRVAALVRPDATPPCAAKDSTSDAHLMYI